ncbi:unnamed protein product, partial [Meganyctiphanes norvegica]
KTVLIALITTIPMFCILISGEWEGANQLVTLQNIICYRNLKGSSSKIQLEPWKEGIANEGLEKSLESMFINQTFYTRSRVFSSLFETFSENVDKKESKRYLITAEQGSGKTTALKKLLKDWCDIINNEHKSFRTFKLAMQNATHNIAEWDVRIHLIMPNLKAIFYNIQGIFFELVNKCVNDTGSLFENVNSLWQTLTKKEKIPVLVFVLKFKDVININTLTDAIHQKIIQDSTLFPKNLLDSILEREVKRILLVLDGWNEYSLLKYTKGAAPELEAIVNREKRQNINLIVTTRPWKSDELLVTRKGFQKLSVESFRLPEDRDNFIHNFFPGGQDAQELINVLNEKDSIIPKELQKHPRMLLYICNIWGIDKRIKDDRLQNRELFWDAIWNMMRMTYNRKYPQDPMTLDDLKTIRREVGILNLEHGKDKSISYVDLYEKFGCGKDMFYYGIFSKETNQKSAPWKEDYNDNMELYVKPVNPSWVDAQLETEINLRSKLNEQFLNIVYFLLFLLFIFYLLYNICFRTK